MSDEIFSTAYYNYELPQELIAQDPVSDRASSRLMVMDRRTGEVSHRVFKELGELLRAGDCLVMNDTRVIPARLLGVKRDTGAAVELLLLKRLDDKADKPAELLDKYTGRCVWECLVKPGKKLKIGAEAVFGGREDGAPLAARITGVTDDGNRLVEFFYNGIWEETLDELGEMPLPPYIKKKLSRDNRERYQTVYARHNGSAAAPTAGLHFTDELIKKLRDKGIRTAFVTLHVGLGTFRPVKTDDVRRHHMHTESCEISDETADIINRTKEAGGRIICVGTTSVRTLESLSDSDGRVRPGRMDTDIFIYPGYSFKVVDGLVTNFHLPQSTLIMLVSAFAGRDHVLAAYAEAVREKYRFFSFGDAMLII